jgi:hypothetical protein
MSSVQIPAELWSAICAYMLGWEDDPSARLVDPRARALEAEILSGIEAKLAAQDRRRQYTERMQQH